VPQGDFDGVIEAYRHTLDAFLKLMIEVATDYCQHWNAKPRSAVVPPAHGCVSPAFATPNGISIGESARESSPTSCSAHPASRCFAGQPQDSSPAR
jgi:hypothetical protein